MDLLVVIHVNSKGEAKYLTSNKVTEIIRKVVRKVYPDMPHDEIMKYPTHSIRVWVCVSLTEAGNLLIS